jgi:small subunit ribosomal protein S1
MSDKPNATTEPMDAMDQELGALVPGAEERVQEESFEAMFEANPTVPEKLQFKAGDRVSGVVTSITNEVAFVDIGGKTEGAVYVRELMGDDDEITVNEGDTLELRIVSIGRDGIQLSKGMRIQGSQGALDAIEDAWSSEVPIEGRVSGTNKGGFDVEIGSAKAFCPISQIDLRYCEEPEKFVGLKDLFKVTQFGEGGYRIVVSRRAVLQQAAEARAEELKDRLVEGEALDGTVTKLMSFGAFVDLGGIEGMIHISQLTRRRVESPAEVVEVGQQVRVQVVKMEETEKGLRIGLSMRALEADPWDTGLPIQEGQVLTGTVARLQPFGAFVELMPGVDGLVHISEISWERVTHPGSVLKEGEEVQVRVLGIDYEKHRVSLSIKQAGDARPEGFGADQGSQAPVEPPRVGQVHKGIVDNLKPFGIFLALPAAGARVRGLLPNEEIEGSTADMRRRFAPGTEVTVEIIANDEQNGLRLSQRAMAEREERGNIEAFTRGSAPKKTAGGMGSFGKLLQAKLKK